jgi:small subunit ribosomal protein S17
MADEEKTDETPDQTPAAEPEAAEPEVAEPEAAEPEAAPEPEPEAAEPEAAEPDAAEPEEAAEVAGESAPVVATTRREQRAAARHAEASQRPARSPEERKAERLAERKRKAEQRRRRRVKEREKAKQQKSAPTEPAIAVHAETTGRPKTRQGRVVSDKADQTITVRIEIVRRHRRYEKIVRSSSTLHAHDPANDAHEGDLVRVVEARPLSKTKRWRLVEVLERAR